MAVVKRKPLWIRLLGKKDSEYDQYEEVKRGDVELIREVSSHVPRHWNYIWGQYAYRDSKCTKTISIGQIVGRGDSKMTIVGYEGPEAQKEWKRDFRQFSGTLRAKNAHLLAVNQSKIPLLIFTSELIPAAQFLDNVGPLVQLYLFALMGLRLGCWWNELWIDPHRGVLCRGPEGPEAKSWVWTHISFEDSMDTPSSVELLRDEICTRFLVGLESKVVDRRVVSGLWFAHSDYSVIEVVEKSHPRDCFWEPIVDHFKVTRPTVVLTLTNTLVAVQTQTLDWSSRGVLGKRVLLANGMTRFTFEDSGWGHLYINLIPDSMEWLLQASSVFHARGIALEDDLSHHRLIAPWLELEGVFSNSESRCLRRHQQPLFLFIHPPTSTPITTRGPITSLHYWSFNEDGRDPLSTKMCQRLGLPVALTVSCASYEMDSWPSEVYKTIHDYQIARGFDPTTPDFARSLGYDQTYTIPDDLSQFADINVDE
ncbi:hypothetical protein V5O48_017568, partial [Marasmius crinis-equi]